MMDVMKKVKLAILSPSDNNFSETFIKVHKTKIDAEVYFYYNGSIPTILEQKGEILKHGVGSRIRRRVDIGLGPANLNDTEKALYRSLSKNKIEVVLAEFGTTAAKSFDVIRALKLPLIIHFHGFDAHQTDVVEENFDRYQLAFEYADSIVAVSQTMKEALINLGAPKNKITVNPCSPNPAFFELSRSLEADNQQIMFVGRFVEKKAPIKLLEAFKLVVEKNKSVKLLMVGDGPLFEKTRRFASVNQLDELTIFLGKLNHNKVKSLMERSFCYVQHSVTASNGDSEGTPVAIMEAAAAGMPIVSTRHAGIQDVVKHGETGYLVEEGDSKSMANYILQVLADAEKANEMGRKSRQFVQENYSQEKAIAVLNGLVLKAVGLE